MNNIILIILTILIIAIITAIMFFLNYKNKSLSNNIKKEKQEYSNFKEKLNPLKKTTPNQEDLNNLNSLAREFFNLKFNLKPNLTYLELAEEFKKQNNPKASNFCNQMPNLLYTGKKINSKKIKELTKLFTEIVESYQTFKQDLNINPTELNQDSNMNPTNLNQKFLNNKENNN